MDYLLKRLVRAGTRRGLGGGHWAWLVLAGAAYALRRARRAESPVVVDMPIHPGERILVTLRDRSLGPEADT